MPLSTADIEDIYSRVPLVRPPRDIYVLKNATVGADRLYEATHHFNAVLREGNYKIFGMTRPNSGWFLMAADGRPSTPIHEALHLMGVHSEGMAHRMSSVLEARANMNMGLVRRQVHYSEVPVTPQERQRILSEMNLQGDVGNVQMVHLTYAPG